VTTNQGRAAEALQVLGDDTRRSIVEELARGEASVGQLAERLPVSRPAVSQHLAVLKGAGLVRDRAEGTRRIYRLDPAGIELLRTYLDLLWSQALDGLAGMAAEPTDHEPTHREPRSEP
jgi:DNA-binding transcriptional ArsR family regulator